MRPKKAASYFGAPELGSFVPMEHSHAT